MANNQHRSQSTRITNAKSIVDKWFGKGSYKLLKNASGKNSRICLLGKRKISLCEPECNQHNGLGISSYGDRLFFLFSKRTGTFFSLCTPDYEDIKTYNFDERLVALVMFLMTYGMPRTPAPTSYRVRTYRLHSRYNVIARGCGNLTSRFKRKYS